jgi:hypothetical protein
MSKRNVLLSDWLSQIRKILGQSETNNLYLVTQKLRRIDVNSRDLAQLCIKVSKVEYPEILYPSVVSEGKKEVIKRLPLTVIYKEWFTDSEKLNAYEYYGYGRPFSVTRFVANDYFKFFDSYGFVEFGTEEYV